MLKIRLSMGGAKKRPIYKIVVADSRFPRDGRFIEKVGFFNPLLPKTKKERVNLEVERIKHWISKGAKPTLRVSRILGEAQVYPMPAKGNNPLKGGILLAIGRKFKLPIIALGMGEKEDDLQIFNAQHYSNALMNS